MIIINKIKIKKIILFSISIFAISLLSCNKKSHIIADTVIIGNIVTMDEKNPIAQVIACKDGKIIFVGSKIAANDYMDFNTKAIDFRDKSVYPGFINTHAHGTLYGFEKYSDVSLGSGKSYDNYVEIIKNYMDKHPNKDFYIASNFIFFGEKPTHELLDKVSSTVPIIAHNYNDNFMLLNKAAMNICNISKDTISDMFDEGIETYENGEPTGLFFKGSVIDKIIKCLPFSIEQVKSYLFEWQDLAFSKGYTSAVEAGSTIFPKTERESYIELCRNNVLKLKTFAFVPIDDKVNITQNDIDNVYETAKINNEFYKILGFKIFFDYSSIPEKYSLIDEFVKDNNNLSNKLISHNELENIIKSIIGHNMDMHFYSNNPICVYNFLNRAKSQNINVFNNSRNLIVKTKQSYLSDYVNEPSNMIPIIPSIWSKISKDVNSSYDSIEIEKINENNELVKPYFNMYPSVPILSIPMNIYLQTNYKANDNLSEKRKKALQRKALLSYTKNAAHVIHEENNMGTIEVGKNADFSVFHFDFYNDILSYEKAERLQPIATIVNGEIVYSE